MMLKRLVIKLSIYVVFVHFLAGCSWITTFAISNKTEGILNIEYSLASFGPQSNPCPDDKMVIIPRIAENKNIENIFSSTIVAQYICNRDTKKINITLNPGDAVSIFQYGTYTGSPRIPADVVALSLSGNDGMISFTGNQLLKHFQKISDSLYVIEYK